MFGKHRKRCHASLFQSCTVVINALIKPINLLLSTSQPILFSILAFIYLVVYSLICSTFYLLSFTSFSH
uniref:Uncharacterized protein n=1 Tax=Octopus bimaculoides TaxID=37653 RepID=A0A0L8HWT3_OCTBM